MMVVAGLLLPISAVWLVLRALRLQEARESAAVAAAISICIGLGVSSMTTFWLETLGAGTGRAFVTTDALLWLTIGVLAIWRIRRNGERVLAISRTRPSSQLSAIDWAVRGAFAIVAALAVAAVVARYVDAPHGEWDAWAIWNQKARFFFRGADHWTAILTVEWANPSHPLFISASVARLWSYAGAELTIVPAAIGFVCGLAIVLAVMGALDVRRNRAWIAGAVLIAPATFTHLVAAQTADLSVGLFVVVTLIMLRKEHVASWLAGNAARASLFVTGVLAALATWTKNEGLVLFAAAFLLVAWMTWRHRQIGRMAWWIAGAAPALLTSILFRLKIAPVPPQYIVQGDTRLGVFERFLDPGRHETIGSLLGGHVVEWGGPFTAGALPLVTIAAAALSFTRAGRSIRAPLAAVAVMLLGYYTVWLLSPIDTAFLIATTFDRLLLQIWPTIVLAAFSALPDDGLVERDAAAAISPAN